MRLIVCGGRDYRDRRRVYAELSRAQPEVLITGEHWEGADLLAKEWAQEHGCPYMGVPANWSFFDRKAGPIRNTWLAKFAGATHCMAFKGGAGTADMIRKAREAGIELIDRREPTG